MPFGLGFGETILIFLMLVLLFGPGKLPELGGSIGKGIREFRDALNGVGEDLPPRVPVAPTLPPPEASIATLEAAAPADEAEPAAGPEPAATGQRTEPEPETPPV